MAEFSGHSQQSSQQGPHLEGRPEGQKEGQKDSLKDRQKGSQKDSQKDGQKNQIAMEESLPIFTEPQCLIDRDGQGALTFNSDVIKQLEMLEKKIVVVAIVGMYRTGKSYLLNRLAGKSVGFALGSTIESKTKGIWIWVRPHPVLEDTYLVLLDTEGLGDAFKGDNEHDHWICILALLLSGTFVYNFLGVINDEMITKLHFVSELSTHIQTRTSTQTGDDHDFDMHFPIFVMAIRDFYLDLEIDGQEVTSDQYLEDLLNLGKKTKGDLTKEDFVESRACIRKYFKTRRCFTFDRPVHQRKKLKNLECVSENELNPEFLKDSEEFMKFIFEECPTVRLPTGNKVTGAALASLVKTYVEAIRRGEVPCIEDAFKTMINMENTKAIEGAIQLYRSQLEEWVAFPTETEEELAEINKKCHQDAVNFFNDKAIQDMDRKFHMELFEQLINIYDEYNKKNLKVSREQCEGALKALEIGIQQKLEEAAYIQPGGFEAYSEDMEKLKKAYSEMNGLGLEKDDVINKYITNAAATTASIAATDKKLTEEDKKAAAMKEEYFKLESEKKRTEENNARLERLAEEKEAANQEMLKQMERNHAEQMQALEKHQEDIQEKRLKEQKRLLKEDMEKESKKMRKEMDESKEHFKEELKQREEAHKKEITEVMQREQERQQTEKGKLSTAKTYAKIASKALATFGAEFLAKSLFR